jgi:hypothetical protein
VILAGSAVLALPAAAQASNGYTSSSIITYTVNLAKSEIDVTDQSKIRNYSSGYYYYAGDIWVPKEAGKIAATADAGAVTQHVVKTDAYNRDVMLNFQPLYSGHTRTLTAKYVIPAGPGASGGFRALKAYTGFCASSPGGVDAGTLNVVVPDGLTVSFPAGLVLALMSDAKGVQTYSTSSNVADGFYSCIQASNTSAFTKSSATAGDQHFDVQAWPEDASWSTNIETDLTADVPKLEDLTGLKMPGGTVTVDEVASSELGDYSGMYDPSAQSASITEDTDNATVAHELSHIWFNGDLFAATWMDEGFARYSEKVAGEGNYKPCTDPGTYKGSGLANLTYWTYLDLNSSSDDVAVANWDYDASCYLVTKLADAMGPANFKAVLAAAQSRRQAYVGGDPANQAPGNKAAITAKQLLDLIDEFGMTPAGVKDPAEAQGLFISYGIVTTTGVTGRTDARAAYHTLLASAGKWGLPLAVQTSMEAWDFATAQKAMATATKILTLRDQIKKTLPDFDQNGTQLEKLFESAKSAADLDSVLTVAQAEADTASKMSEATSAKDGSHNPLQAIGLLGTDLGATMTQATTELSQAKPADASASAQKVIDDVNGATVLGLVRLLLLIVLLLLAGALAFLGRWLMRRRAAMALATATAVGATVDMPATTAAVAVALPDGSVSAGAVSAETATPPPSEPPV